MLLLIYAGDHSASSEQELGSWRYVDAFDKLRRKRLLEEYHERLKREAEVAARPVIPANQSPVQPAEIEPLPPRPAWMQDILESVRPDVEGAIQAVMDEDDAIALLLLSD